MEYIVPPALSNAWRQYHYINHSKDKDAIIHCEDINQSLLFWEAFKHFFKIQVEPKEFIEATSEVRKNYEVYQKPTKNAQYPVFKTYLKEEPFEMHPLVYSIIDSDTHQKGIHYKSKLNIIKNLNGINLGDSRNFKDADELIHKIIQLANAETFLGSSCSWAWICPYFDTTWIEIKEYNFDWHNDN
jgi:hypothetical protein